MVVLEGSAMLSSANNQYLQPDYLSSLPTTLDAKKSPLALLAQTCSQIGVDTPASKLLNSPSEKLKKSSVTENIRSSSTHKTKAYQHGLPPEESTTPLKVCDKKVLTKNVIYGAEYSVQECVDEKRELVSPATSCLTPNYESAKNSPEQKSTTPSISPLIAHKKESLSCGVLSEGLTNNTNDHLNICCSNGDQSNPAFRSSFPVTYNFHHNSYPSGYPSTSPGPFSNFVRMKTNAGGETMMPVCKDPYCTGCQFSLHNQQLILNSVSGSCPSDCSQCDNQKYNLAMAMSFIPGTIPSSLTYGSLVRPYICNWISGDAYCGKRFVTSEELLQHLRSHTTGMDTVSVPTSSATSLLNPVPLFTSTSLHRLGYVNSINSLSPMRYHPYGKASLQTLIGSSYSAFNPTMFGPYYSPYTVYSQRLGPTTVHQ